MFLMVEPIFCKWLVKDLKKSFLSNFCKIQIAGSTQVTSSLTPSNTDFRCVVLWNGDFKHFRYAVTEVTSSSHSCMGRHGYPINRTLCPGSAHWPDSLVICMSQDTSSMSESYIGRKLPPSTPPQSWPSVPTKHTHTHIQASSPCRWNTMTKSPRAKVTISSCPIPALWPIRRLLGSSVLISRLSRAFTVPDCSLGESPHVPQGIRHWYELYQRQIFP